ncbi:MAG: hypothetical protein AABX47_01860 [Nanoarchaeota archaeon]
MPKITYKSQPKASAGEPQFSFCGSAVGLILIFASIGVIAILGDNITGAQNVDFSDPDSLFQFIDKGSAEINKYNDQVPSFLKSLFGNERIIGTIYLSSGDALIVGAVTKDGKVIQFQRGEIDNPTLKVYTDESVIRKLMSSKDPAMAAKAALDNREIRYEAVTFAGEVKYGTTSFVSRVLSWFGW